MKLYRIRDWDTIYENNRTRDLKQLAWVPIPNGHDGDGYTQLVSHPDGAAMLGAWVACVQVASKCDPRGTLVRRSGLPHDADSLSRITRLPVKIFERMLSVASSECNWLIVSSLHDDAGIPQEGAVKSQEGALNGMEGKEGNGMEGNEKEEPPAPAAKSAAERLSIELTDYWNSKPGLRHVQSMSKDRMKSLGERSKEPFFLENWRTGIDRISQSSFCLGRNDRKWIADVDFFLRPGSLTKVMEGKYDDKQAALPLPEDPNAVNGF